MLSSFLGGYNLDKLECGDEKDIEKTLLQRNFKTLKLADNGPYKLQSL